MESREDKMIKADTARSENRFKKHVFTDEEYKEFYQRIDSIIDLSGAETKEDFMERLDKQDYVLGAKSDRGKEKQRNVLWRTHQQMHGSGAPGNAQFTTTSAVRDVTSKLIVKRVIIRHRYYVLQYKLISLKRWRQKK